MKKINTLSVIVASLAIMISSSNAQDLMYMDQTGATPHLFIQAGGQVYVQGGVVANNTVSASSGVSGAGDLYIVDVNTPLAVIPGNNATNVNAHWTDNTAAGNAVSTTAPSTGTVYLVGGNVQNATGQTTFYNLQIRNSSADAAATGIQITNNSFIKVANALTLTDGIVHGQNNAHVIITNPASPSLVAGAGNAAWNNSMFDVLYVNNASFDRQMVNSGAIYNFPIGFMSGANTARLQLLEITPTNVTGISRLASSWETGVVGNSPLATLYECPLAGQPYDIIHPYGEWHLRPANGGVYGAGSFAAGSMSISSHFNIPSGGFTAPGLLDNYFSILFRAQGSGAAGMWSKPTPGCTTLPPVGNPGRTVASDFAARVAITAFSDNLSQLGIGITYWPLPVELLSFTGWNDGPVNQLQWITSSEHNSDYFDLQRSPTGSTDFTGIGKVDAAGYSIVPLTYHFTDEQPYHGLNYYRLKMVDLDNSFKFSNVVVIELKDQSTQTINIYPNPTLGDINLQIHSEDDQDVIIEVTDVLGRTVISQRRNVIPGNNVFNLDLKDLASASYFLRVHSVTNDDENTFKIVKTN